MNLFLPLAFFFFSPFGLCTRLYSLKQVHGTNECGFCFFQFALQNCAQWRFFFFLSQKTPKNCNEEQKTWLCPKTGPLTCSKYLLGSVLRFPQNHRSWTSAFPSRAKAKLRFLTTRSLAIPIDSQSDQSACCGRSRGSPSGHKRMSSLRRWVAVGFWVRPRVAGGGVWGFVQRPQPQALAPRPGDYTTPAPLCVEGGDWGRGRVCAGSGVR